MSRSFQPAVCKAARYAASLLTLAALILAVVALPTPAAAESTINCPAGTYDMLDWIDLIPSFGTRLSMISDEGKGKRYVEEQAHGGADDWGAETTGGGA